MSCFRICVVTPFLAYRALVLSVVLAVASGCSDSSDDWHGAPNLPVWEDEPCSSLVETGRYEELMSRWGAQTDAAPFEVARTAFTGSSSIRYWERLQEDLSDWAPIQRGFGGSILWEVAEYIDETVLRHQPQAVVIFAGTNDISLGLKPEEVSDAYRCVVERIAQSLGDEVSIHYIAITPTPARWAIWPDSDAANQLIKDIAEDWPGLHFIDTTPAFLATGEPPDSSLFVADGLHLSDTGYAMWLEAIFPHLEATVQRFRLAPDSLVPGTRILVDLGPSNAEDGTPTESPDAFGQHWNNWYPTGANVWMSSGEQIGSLVDVTGQPTQLRLVYAAATHFPLGIRDGGLLEPDPALLGTLAVPTATQDYIYTVATGTVLNGRGALTIERLDPQAQYTLRLFASRTGAQIARTQYNVTGDGGSLAAQLTVSGTGIGHDEVYSGNDDEIVELSDLMPDSSGRLHIDFETVEQALGSRAYLSVIELTVQ